jgi:hypothetical protein
VYKRQVISLQSMIKEMLKQGVEILLESEIEEDMSFSLSHIS